MRAQIPSFHRLPFSRFDSACVILLLFAVAAIDPSSVNAQGGKVNAEIRAVNGLVSNQFGQRQLRWELQPNETAMTVIVQLWVQNLTDGAVPFDLKIQIYDGEHVSERVHKMIYGNTGVNGGMMMTGHYYTRDLNKPLVDHQVRVLVSSADIPLLALNETRQFINLSTLHDPMGDGREDAELLSTNYMRAALLDYCEIRAAIDLSSDQQNKLDQLRRESGLRSWRYEEKLMELEEGEARRLSNEFRKKNNAQLYRDEMKVLNPEQLKRLNQITNQRFLEIAKDGCANFDNLADYLKLDDSQRAAYTKLAADAKAKESAVRGRLMQKRRELQKKSRKAILDLLTDQQREQMNSILGNPFDFDSATASFGDADAFRELREPKGQTLQLHANLPADEAAYKAEFLQSSERRLLLSKQQTKIMEELGISPMELDAIAIADQKNLELNGQQQADKANTIDELKEAYEGILQDDQLQRVMELGLQLRIANGRAGVDYSLFFNLLNFPEHQERRVRETTNVLHQQLLESQQAQAETMLKINQEYYRGFVELLSKNQQEQAANLIGDLFIPEYDLDLSRRADELDQRDMMRYFFR